MKRCPYCAEEIQDAAIVCKHCGRDLKFGTAVVTKWETEARELLRTGKTIEAIKTVRGGTGLDLKGAKDLVDGWRRQDPSASLRSPAEKESRSDAWYSLQFWPWSRTSSIEAPDLVVAHNGRL